MITFLKDPTGDLPWDEEENSKDVVHLKSESAVTKMIKKSKLDTLVMFYAPCMLVL
jgi:protein disulfide isomerase family A protein 5